MRVAVAVLLAFLFTQPSWSADEDGFEVAIFDSLLRERSNTLVVAYRQSDKDKIKLYQFLVKRALDRCLIIYGEETTKELAIATEKLFEKTLKDCDSAIEAPAIVHPADKALSVTLKD